MYRRVLSLMLAVAVAGSQGAWGAEPAVVSVSRERPGAKVLAVSGGITFGLSYLAAVIGAFVVAADVSRIDPATGTVVGGVMAVPVLGPLLVGTFVRSPVVNDWRVGLLVDAGVQLVGLSLLILGCVLDAGGAGTEIRLSETASVRFGEAGLVQFRF